MRGTGPFLKESKIYPSVTSKEQLSYISHVDTPTTCNGLVFLTPKRVKVPDWERSFSSVMFHISKFMVERYDNLMSFCPEYSILHETSYAVVISWLLGRPCSWWEVVLGSQEAWATEGLLSQKKNERWKCGHNLSSFLISAGSTRIWKLTKPEMLHFFFRAWDSPEKAFFSRKRFFQKLFEISLIHCPQRHYSKWVDIKMTYSDNFSWEWTNFPFGHKNILKTN